MMKKSILLLSLLALAAIAFNACSSDDEDDRFVVCPTENGIIGEWQFVEMLDGPGSDMTTHRGGEQPKAHTMYIGIYNNIIYAIADGTTQECIYYYPEDQSHYNTKYPVIIITDPRVNQPGTPFGIELNDDELKLHYLGIYTTDHIPETYVYRRVK